MQTQRYFVEVRTIAPQGWPDMLVGTLPWFHSLVGVSTFADASPMSLAEAIKFSVQAFFRDQFEYRVITEDEARQRYGEGAGT